MKKRNIYENFDFMKLSEEERVLLFGLTVLVMKYADMPPKRPLLEKTFTVMCAAYQYGTPEIDEVLVKLKAMRDKPSARDIDKFLDSKTFMMIASSINECYLKDIIQRQKAAERN